MEDFFSDCFKGVQIRIEKDDSDTAVIREVAEHIDKAQV